jgi:hypothetical protein
LAADRELAPRADPHAGGRRACVKSASASARRPAAGPRGDISRVSGRFVAHTAGMMNKRVGCR